MPLRADGFAVWALRSPGSRITAPVRLPEVVYLSGLFRTEAPRSQLRDSTGFAPDSLGALREMLALETMRHRWRRGLRIGSIHVTPSQRLTVMQGDIGVAAAGARPDPA